MLSRKAQHIAEFAVLAGMILLGFSAVSTYVKRGLQGRYKQFADSVYEQAFDEDVTGRQYEPYYLVREMNSSKESGGNFTYDDSIALYKFHRDSYSTVEGNGTMTQVPFVKQ